MTKINLNKLSSERGQTLNLFSIHEQFYTETEDEVGVPGPNLDSCCRVDEFKSWILQIVLHLFNLKAL